MQKGNIHSRRRSSGGVLATTLDGTGSGALWVVMMRGLTALERVLVLVGGKRNALRQLYSDRRSAGRSFWAAADFRSREALQLPVARSLLTVTFPRPHERARAIAVWGGFNGLAMAVGPTLGGLLVDHLGWWSIFYLVLPFGLAILALPFAGVSESANPQGREIDLPGQILAVLTLGSFAFACIQISVPGLVLSADHCFVDHRHRQFDGISRDQTGDAGRALAIAVLRQPRIFRRHCGCGAYDIRGLRNALYFSALFADVAASLRAGCGNRIAAPVADLLPS